MITLTKFVTVIAQCEFDKPAIFNNDGRVERIVFKNHVLCVRWNEDGKRVVFQNSHNVPKDFKLNVLEDLKEIFEDYLEKHRDEFLISLNYGEGTLTVMDKRNY